MLFICGQCCPAFARMDVPLKWKLQRWKYIAILRIKAKAGSKEKTHSEKELITVLRGKKASFPEFKRRRHKKRVKKQYCLICYHKAPPGTSAWQLFNLKKTRDGFSILNFYTQHTTAFYGTKARYYDMPMEKFKKLIELIPYEQNAEKTEFHKSVVSDSQNSMYLKVKRKRLRRQKRDIYPEHTEKISEQQEEKSTVVSTFSIPISTWHTTAIEKNNPHGEILNRNANKLIKSFEDNEKVGIEISTWHEIRGWYISKLFPDCRLYMLSYKMFPLDPGNKPVGLAGGLYYTLFIDKHGESYKFYGSGNYEDFGSFLAKQGIKIQSSRDANMIWGAFCEIHQKQWYSQGVRKITDTLWHIGVKQGSDREYYYEIRSDSDMSIKSGRLCSKKIKKKDNQEKYLERAREHGGTLH